jgi:hypothetical protein
MHGGLTPDIPACRRIGQRLAGRANPENSGLTICENVSNYAKENLDKKIL